MASRGRIANVLNKRAKPLPAEWLKDVTAASGATSGGRVSNDELEKQTGQFLALLAVASEGKHAGLL